MMAQEIENPQVTRFANERVRPLADQLARLRRDAQAFIEDYNAQNLGSLIDKAGAENLLADGSETDGRPRITGGSIYNLVTMCQEFVKTDGFMEAGRTSVVNSIQVNGNK